MSVGTIIAKGRNGIVLEVVSDKL